MTRSEIEGWLLDWLSDELGFGVDDFEKDRSIGTYGINARQLEQLACDIEEFFEEPLESGIVVKRATIEKLTRELCILMDTDEEEFAGEEPVRDQELLQDLRLSGIA